jgi:hypothetical protein
VSKGGAERFEISRRWTVNPAGNTFYRLLDDNSGLEEYDIVQDEPRRRIKSSDLREQGVRAGLGPMAYFGIAAASNGSVAFSVATPGTEEKDSAGFLEPTTVIISKTSQRPVTLTSQVPIAFLDETCLLTIGFNEAGGDYATVSAFDMEGNKLGSLPGVVTAAPAGGNIAVLKIVEASGRRKVTVEIWDRKFEDKLAANRMPIFEQLDLNLDDPVIQGIPVWNGSLGSPGPLRL